MEPGKDKYRLLVEHLPDAFAYHQNVMDSEGNPVDYIFLEVNPAFEKMTGLSREQVIGKKATKLPPDIENYSIDWIRIFGKVALTGENASFEHYFDISDRWYAVTAYSDEPGYFAVFFRDITEVKQAEEALRQRLLELESIYTVSSALRSAETLDEMLNILIDETLKVLGTEDGAVFFYHPTKEALRFTATRGWFNQLDDAWLKPGEGIAWEVFVSGQVLVSREFAKDSRVKYIESMPEGCGGVCFPIRTAKDVVGTMFVSVPLPREITREELNLLASLSEIASTAIHRISLFQETVNLLENLQESNIELLLAYDATLEGWSRALELRDHETEGHSERVADKTIQIAMLLNVPDDELVNIRRGSLLHDIGKIGIPDAVLLKPGKLSPQEWGMMQQHPKLAYELLSPVDYLHPALDIPYCHHEKWDGSGYPRGLKGKEIPLAARIFAVIDVYDALTSDRPYRLAWSKQEVLEHICEQSGKHFDPQVVEVFENLFDP